MIPNIPDNISVAIVVAAAYLIGAIPFGVLIARAQGVDLQTCGSGNTGSTNVGRVLGRKWGLLCFFLDVLKGLLPVFVVGMLLKQNAATAADQTAATAAAMSIADQFIWLATAFAAVFGHVFSIFLKFKGGKGVATSLGILLGVWPHFTVAAIAVFVIWVAITYTSGYVSLASIISAASFPVLFAAWCAIRSISITGHWPLLAFTVVMALLVIVKHKSNIARLAAGTESRVKWSRPGRS